MINRCDVCGIGMPTLAESPCSYCSWWAITAEVWGKTFGEGQLRSPYFIRLKDIYNERSNLSRWHRLASRALYKRNK